MQLLVTVPGAGSVDPGTPAASPEATPSTVAHVAARHPAPSLGDTDGGSGELVVLGALTVALAVAMVGMAARRRARVPERAPRS